MRPLFLFLFAASLFAQPAPVKNLDSCSLVAKADVQQVTGMTAADPAPNKTNPAVCDFKLAGMGVVSFTLQRSRPGETPDKMMEELKKRKIAVAEAKAGDRSFFANHGYGMVQLNTFKGPHYVILTLMLPTTPEAKTKDIAEKLMTKALAKL